MIPGITVRITLIGASALTVLAGAAVSAALPSITNQFRDTPYSELLTKMVITVPAICIALSSPFMGWLTDKAGRIPVLISSLFLYLAGGVAAIWMPSLVLLLICRFVLGLGVAGISTSANAIIADLFRAEERSRFISRQSSATAIAGVLFISAGGWLASFGWQYPFYVYVMALPVLILVLLRFRNPDKVKKISVNEVSTPRIPKVIYRYYGIIFLTMIVFYMIPAQMPYLLSSRFQLGSTYIGIAIASSILASAISSWNFYRLQQYFSTPGLLLLAALINGTGYIGISMAGNTAILIAALFVSGFGNGIFMPLVSRKVMDLSPVHVRGRIMGGLYSSIFTGQFLSPILLMPLIDWSGKQVAFGLVGGALVVAASILFFLDKSRK